jgi:hypothetical protein
MQIALDFIRDASPQIVCDEERPEPPRKTYTCGPIVTYNGSKDTEARLVVINSTNMIFGYLSRSGDTVFESASLTEFNFLDLDRFNPPIRRHETREKEDVFCQKLLLLGAKWCDCMRRSHLLTSEKTDLQALVDSDEPEPTMRE